MAMLVVLLAAPLSRAQSQGAANDDQASAQGGADDDDSPHPGIQLQREHYADSDHKVLDSETLATTQWLGNFLATYTLDAARASDRDGYARADTSTVALHRDFGDGLSLDMALGDFRTLEEDSWSGSIEGGLNLNDLSITTGIARGTIDALTAQAMRLNLRQTDFLADVSDSIFENVTADLEGHHLEFTDGNRANQLSLSTKYDFGDEADGLSVGYQLNYAAFAITANDGYWSPRFLLSHEAVVKWAGRWRNLYGKVELSGGYQAVATQDRVESESGDAYGGGSGYDVSASATVGASLRPNTRVEYSLSGERSVGWSSAASVMNLRFNF
jgi:hypothetical protein